MVELKPCRSCRKLPVLTLRHDELNFADIRCDCATTYSVPNDPTGEKVVAWWNKTQEPPVVTNLEWLKAPERTAAEIAEFIRTACSEAARAEWCDSFDGDCQACLESWLNSRRRENG